MPLPQTRHSTPPDPREGIGVAHGTFGELLQGALGGTDNHFLVTLPIQNFSRVTFTPNPSSNRVTVTPPHKSKSRELVQKLVDHYEPRCGGHLRVESELPEGKGMASSSADLVASARAFEAAVTRTVPTELMLRLLRAIEPTDGVMYPEFVTFFHRKVELGRRLGSLSRLKIVAVDEGGQIDTIEYNRRNHRFTDQECAEYAGLLPAIERAILDNDLTVVGQISTRSAILNQKRNPKRHLAGMIEIGKQVQALGVVVAHSGPCVGLIFPDEPTHQERIESAKRSATALSDNVFVVQSLQAVAGVGGSLNSAARAAVCDPGM